MELLSEALRSPIFWLTFVVLVVYLYLKYVIYNRWNQNVVPHDPPSIPLGNVPLSYFTGDFNHGDLLKKSYAKYKKHRFYGLYILTEPVLVITDPQLIQRVLVKNFDQFPDRGVLSDVHKDPLTLGIIRLEGAKWKRLRVKLSPTFTSGKIKLMYPLIKDIGDKLVIAFNEELKMSEFVEVDRLIVRYTIDCIASIAFGFDCNSLQHPDNEVFKHGSIGTKLGKAFLLFTVFIPKLTKFMPLPESRKIVGKFFVQLFNDMITSRRENPVARNDFLQMLIQLMDTGKVEDNPTSSTDTSIGQVTDLEKLTMEEAVAQSFQFFSAGFETVSSTIIACLYELSFKQDIQDKLFKEISEVYNVSGEVTYEQISEMKYLDLVCKEILRKLSVAPQLNRICVKDFEVPDSNFTIQKGTRIIIPAGEMHRDPDIYPDPDNFDPDRFLPENKEKRHGYTYLPFGEGPRHCIGKRMGTLEPKIAIFNLILKYKFYPCEKTDIPMKLLPNYVLSAPHKVYLKVESRTNNNPKIG